MPSLPPSPPKIASSFIDFSSKQASPLLPSYSPSSSTPSHPPLPRRKSLLLLLLYLLLAVLLASTFLITPFFPSSSSTSSPPSSSSAAAARQGVAGAFNWQDVAFEALLTSPKLLPTTGGGPATFEQGADFERKAKEGLGGRFSWQSERERASRMAESAAQARASAIARIAVLEVVEVDRVEEDGDGWTVVLPLPTPRAELSAGPDRSQALCRSSLRRAEGTGTVPL